MGFLDHSTSNIIVDAVLTDIGRQFLARNDGSFSIVKFALADDEVDYTMIQKFGRVVGKEKIEKNTPVFEAQTTAGLALKYRNVSLSNPNLIRMPNMSITGEGLDTGGTVLSMTVNSNNSTRQLTFTQAVTGESSVDVELRDQQFLVKIPNQFVQIVGAAPDYVDRDGVAFYTLIRSPTTTAAGGSILSFTMALKSITDTQFTIFGTSSDKTKINVVASVTGLQSGTVKNFTINISK
jgi:hypothetical protein